MNREHHRLCNLNDPDTKPYLKGCNCAGMAKEHDNVAVLRDQATMIAKAGREAMTQGEYLTACECALRFVQSPQLADALTREAAPAQAVTDELLQRSAGLLRACQRKYLHHTESYFEVEKLLHDIASLTSNAAAKAADLTENDKLMLNMKG